MKAMILAAGLGTRLEHHTIDRPKALVQVNGKPLLAYVLEKIVSAGFTEVVINVHHFADQIVDYLKQHDFGVKINISDETNRLLNTGGGILKAQSFLNGEASFLVHNVDILSNIDLKQLVEFHEKNKSFATLAVGDRKSSRHFLFDQNMKLAGWRNNLTGKEIIPTKVESTLKGFAFAGIHVVSPDFFNQIHNRGAFSIVDAYLSLCSSQSIIGFDTSNNFVVDVGKPKNLEIATDFATRINQSAN